MRRGRPRLRPRPGRAPSRRQAVGPEWGPGGGGRRLNAPLGRPLAEPRAVGRSWADFPAFRRAPRASRRRGGARSWKPSRALCDLGRLRPSGPRFGPPSRALRCSGPPATPGWAPAGIFPLGPPRHRAGSTRFPGRRELRSGLELQIGGRVESGPPGGRGTEESVGGSARVREARVALWGRAGRRHPLPPAPATAIPGCWGREPSG